MQTDLENILKGGDLRSMGQSNKIVQLTDSQKKFDDLFRLLFHSDRKVVMRAADAIEKITIDKTEYLYGHKKEIMELTGKAQNKELKWHLALLASRLILSAKEFEKLWYKLSEWATNKKESKIVRVNSLQGLFELLSQNNKFQKEFYNILSQINKENIPSLNARIKKINNSLPRVAGIL